MSENTNSAAETVRAEGTSGREENGRFARGNAGGPGNPFARQVAELRQAMYRVVSAEDIEAITKAIVQRAKEGHVVAAKLVFAYVLGRPQQAADGDRGETQREAAVVRKAPEAERASDAGRRLSPQFEDLLRAETSRETVREEARMGRQQTGKTVRGSGVSPLPNGIFDPSGDSAGLRVVPPTTGDPGRKD